MRIGIVGGGGAGLSTAWLLDDDHAVTLFEKQNRLGGHAETVWVEQNGASVPIDAGSEFFSDYMFPTFHRLLAILGVARRPFAATTTFYTTDQRRVLQLPPLRGRRVVGSMFLPRPLSTMLEFRHVLNAASHLMEARDTSLTLAQFLDPLSLSPAFKEDFLYPYLLAGWCVGPEEFRQFAAYDVLRYTYMHKTSGLSAATFVEPVGGTQAYVNALARSLVHTTVRLGADITHVARRGTTFLVQEADGGRSEFDHLVIATNAYEAQALLKELDRRNPITPIITGPG